MTPTRFSLASGVAVAALASLFFSPSGAQAADTPTPLVAGSTLETLTVGNTTYRHLLIRSVSAQTAMIQHDAGIASIRLRDLPVHLQQRFGYDPGAALAEAEKQKAASAAAEQRRQEMLATAKKTRVPKAPAPAREDSTLDRFLLSVGQPPEVLPVVDLRPRFRELGLWVKDQGTRPSCSVFAIVSALEFQSAEINGKPERFSEEYLLWATRKTLSRLTRDAEAVSPPAEDTADATNTDAGYALHEVVMALRSYGVPPLERMHTRFAGDIAQDPSEELIQEARSSRRVSVHNIPGRDGPSLVENLVQALNAGIPVPVGMAWPIEYNQRSGYLDTQPTSDRKGHAVTIVGYKSPTGRIEDAVFTFKNSWGVSWGVNGYGTATYAYLSKHLHTAVILEVQPQAL